MKKKLVIFLACLVVAGSNAWADNMALGLSSVGVGVTSATAGVFLLDDPVIGGTLLGVGGLLIIVGIWVALTPDSSNHHTSVAQASIENNIIIRHTLFDATSDGITLGVRFNR